MMNYKILLLIPNSPDYYKYYRESDSEGDWKTDIKEDAIAKIQELILVYGLDEMSVVIDLDINTIIDIPNLPTIVEPDPVPEVEEPTE